MHHAASIPRPDRSGVRPTVERAPGTVVVTGAAGFIGSHLCERLLADGYDVVGVDNFSTFYNRTRKEDNLRTARRSRRFRLHEADLMTADLDAILDGACGIFHLAARAGVRDSWGDTFAIYTRDNVGATQRLLEALRRNPVPAVFASSSSVYGDAPRLPVKESDPLAPSSPYGLTKLATEHLARIYVKEYGLNVVSLRYFTVFGPRQRPDMAFTRFLSAALAGEPIRIFGDGRQTRDFTYVSDVVDATVRALRGPAGAVYNIGGGTPASLEEVLLHIAQAVGASLHVEPRPRALGDVAHTWADTTRARDELGWSAQVSLEDGLGAQLEWLRDALPVLAAA
ncbi:MAG TPA: NAD-dependent epimerase/dehydratase family protein [Candidatus Saccharimonadales bacterium]|nr:NAD-dependent epimerase/dehydratase family protein [Candidatus Saccharimonadales bacterium]